MRPRGRGGKDGRLISASVGPRGGGIGEKKKEKGCDRVSPLSAAGTCSSTKYPDIMQHVLRILCTYLGGYLGTRRDEEDLPHLDTY